MFYHPKKITPFLGGGQGSDSPAGSLVVLRGDILDAYKPLMAVLLSDISDPFR